MSAAWLLALGLTLGGCATVSPWERERLASRRMQLDPDPMAAELEQQTHDHREAASGGLGGAGGGCGCN
ncbi:MAG: DUF4266 domain-containing protein [Deltaproteobacteria bacterium]|nr:DUF4266 domain-containing protein [Deltaproteobacteria bacterium]